MGTESELGSIAPAELPSSLSSFVGRGEELAIVTALLARTRMLTLAGPGGVGKSRLADQVARAVAAANGDGLVVAELARVERPEHVPAAVLVALQSGELPGESQLGSCARRIGDRQLLLVLDNCEHLQREAAVVAGTLLARCPRLRVLATSRTAPLGVPGETVWRVPGMGLPESDGETGADTNRSEAVQLFLVRAQEAVGLLEPDQATTAAMAAICRELDGLPLAIELAAARMTMLSATEIAAGLSDRLRLLAAARAPAVRHHRTLRDSLDWSYELLGDSERKLLRRLSVFAGGFTLPDVEAVCADAEPERRAMLDTLGALIESSLVACERRGEQVRYRLLETIREYAAERLAAVAETESARRRHWRHFLTLAADADTLRLDAEGRERLRDEQPNMRAALERAAAAEPAAALAIAAGLSKWWLEVDLYQEGRAGCAQALAVSSGEEDPGLLSLVYWAEGMFALYQSDLEGMRAAMAEAVRFGELAGDPLVLARVAALTSGALAVMSPRDAVEHGERSVAYARGSGDPVELASALATLGNALLAVDDYRGARVVGEQATAMAEGHPDAVTTAWCWWVLSSVELFEGNPKAAGAIARRIRELLGDTFPALTGLALAQLVICEAQTGGAAAIVAEAEAADQWADATMPIAAAALEPSLALAYLALGELKQAMAIAEPAARSGFAYYAGQADVVLAQVALAAGEPDAALAAVERLAQRPGLDTARFRAHVAHVRGRAALLRGDRADATALLHEALAIEVELGAALLTIETLEALAVCLGGGVSGAAIGAASARLLAAATAERARRQTTRPLEDDRLLQRLADDLQVHLGRERFARAWAEGSALALPAAVAYVQRARGPRQRAARGWDALTRTERQVAELAAAGRSNPEIATALFISRGTVKAHLSRAYAKLGVATRTQLAVLAVRDERWGG